MQNLVRRRLSALLLMGGVVSFSACGDSPTDPSSTVASVTVAPTPVTLTAVGATQLFSATARTSDNTVVSGATFTWSSSDPAVASVDDTGLVTALAGGTTNITATSGTVSGSATLTVAQEVASITVMPADETITGVGAEEQFVAEALDSGGAVVSPAPTFTWSSDADSIATVDADGVVTAEARGTTTITASVGAVSGSGDITVLGILHYTDDNLGTNVVPGALGLLGTSATEPADATEFATLIAEGGWGIVIMGEQNAPYFSTVETALDAYLAAGGRVIAATYSSSSALIAFMEATNGPGTNYAEVITDAHPIFDGLGTSVSVADPGWGTYARSYEADGSADCLGSTSAGGCAGVLGNGDQTILLGPLFDAYGTVGDGSTLVSQAITFLLEATPNPTAIGPVAPASPRSRAAVAGESNRIGSNR